MKETNPYFTKYAAHALASHKPAFAIAIAGFLLGITALIPFEPDTVGLVSVLPPIVTIVALLTIPPTLVLRSSASVGLYLLALSSYWLVLGLIVETAIRRKFRFLTWGVAILGIPILAFNLCMFPFSLFSILNPPLPDTSCERALSETNGIRIIHHVAGGWMGDTTLFFMFSVDKGKTWRKMDSRIFDWEEMYTSLTPNCDKIGWLDDHFIWVWFGGEAKIFRDGKLVQSIGPCDIRSCIPYSFPTINTIQFQDPQNGYVLLTNVSDSAVKRFVTSDGGKTWSPE